MTGNWRGPGRPLAGVFDGRGCVPCSLARRESAARRSAPQALSGSASGDPEPRDLRRRVREGEVREIHGDRLRLIGGMTSRQVPEVFRSRLTTRGSCLSDPSNWPCPHRRRERARAPASSTTRVKPPAAAPMSTATRSVTSTWNVSIAWRSFLASPRRRLTQRERHSDANQRSWILGGSRRRAPARRRSSPRDLPDAGTLRELVPELTQPGALAAHELLL